jgi:AmpE protein
MKFLVILIVLIFQRNWAGGNPLRELFQAEAWFAWVSGRVAAGNPRFLLGVLAPTLMVLLLSWELSGWFLGLLWLGMSVVVVLYCIEIVDTDTAFDDQVLWLRGLDKDDELIRLQRSQSNFRSDITCDVFQGMAPTLFWFLLLGPAGALLVTLCRRYQDQVEEDDLPELILFWMEWVPARITVFLFALLGEFAPTWQVFTESLADLESPAGTILLKAVESGSVVANCTEDFIEETGAELVYLKDLLERSLWGWLGLAALLTIAGL